MSADINYYTHLLLLLPATTALVCFIFTALYRNKNDGTKNNDRKVLLAYFITAFLCWTYGLSLYTQHSVSWFGTTLGNSMNLLIPLLFYHAVCRLTNGPEKFQFPIHYAIAVSIILFLFAAGEWYATFDQRNATGFENRIARAYPLFAASIGELFKITYVALSLYRLTRYRNVMISKIGGKKGNLKYMLPAMYLFTIIVLFVPTGWFEMNDLPMQLILALSAAGVSKYIYLNYKWVYGCTAKARRPDEKNNNARAESKYMTKQQKFEHYIDNEKPFLNQKLRIEDVARDLNTNRTYVSTFINETYGMNFSAYVNCKRMEEFERLMADPENSAFSKYDLAIKAGFGSYRNSTRVRKCQQMEEVKSIK